MLIFDSCRLAMVTLKNFIGSVPNQQKQYITPRLMCQIYMTHHFNYFSLDDRTIAKGSRAERKPQLRERSESERVRLGRVARTLYPSPL